MIKTLIKLKIFKFVLIGGVSAAYTLKRYCKKKNEVNKKYGLKFFLNYKKAVLKTSPDVVIILTPSGLHAEHILYCLKKNCHVIVEKPMCLKESDGKKILSLSKKLNILNFNSTLYTEVKSSCNVIIVDVVGILADLYKYSDVAYIGGGFTRGVHSVIEPAIYDCIIDYKGQLLKIQVKSTGKVPRKNRSTVHVTFHGHYPVDKVDYFAIYVDLYEGFFIFPNNGKQTAIRLSRSNVNSKYYNNYSFTDN